VSCEPLPLEVDARVLRLETIDLGLNAVDRDPEGPDRVYP